MLSSAWRQFCVETPWFRISLDLPRETACAWEFRLHDIHAMRCRATNDSFDRLSPPHFPFHVSVQHWSERFLGITGWDPSVCKSNRLHGDILRFSFINLGYILFFPLHWSAIFLQSWTSTGYFSNSTGSSVTNCRFSPIIAVQCVVADFM